MTERPQAREFYQRLARMFYARERERRPANVIDLAEYRSGKHNRAEDLSEEEHIEQLALKLERAGERLKFQYAMRKRGAS